jgi:hypothetical protein
MRKTFLIHQSTGAILACVILITSVNCFCGVIQISGHALGCCHGQSADCCAASHHAPGKSGQPQCPHCQGTLIADHSQSPSLTPDISPGHLFLISYSELTKRQFATALQHSVEDNFSPLMPANSLLRQNCALIL